MPPPHTHLSLVGPEPGEGVAYDTWLFYVVERRSSILADVGHAHEYLALAVPRDLLTVHACSLLSPVLGEEVAQATSSLG